MKNIALLKAISNAVEYLNSNDEHKNLFLSIPADKKMKIENMKDESKLERLASIGVINLYTDDTYKISQIGKQVFDELK
jgi:hypothetical protein